MRTSTTEGRFSGTKLRAARERAGLRREHVAFALGVSVSAVGYWESGHATPQVNRLPALCRTLECSVEDLFEDSNG